jgi:hypothetical protein
MVLGRWRVGVVQVSYFDTYPGFAVVGGIALIVYLFVAIAMLQCDHRHRPENSYTPFP